MAQAGLAPRAGPVTLPWPAGVESWLAFATVSFAWVLSTYAALGNAPILVGLGDDADATVPPTWRRRTWERAALITTLTLVAVQPFGAAVVGLALTLGIAAVVLPTIRHRLATHPPRSGERRLGVVAEWEVTMTAAVLAAIGAWIGAVPLGPRALVRLPVTDMHLEIILGVGAAVVYAAGAGTHIVRGVLDKAHTLPPAADLEVQAPGDAGLLTASGRRVDRDEYQRGRIIGVVERLVLVAVVADGHFEALAFLVAAKGLIRANELKNRDFAEYFLIGTLTSTLLAIVAGLAVRVMVARW